MSSSVNIIKVIQVKEILLFALSTLSDIRIGKLRFLRIRVLY